MRTEKEVYVEYPNGEKELYDLAEDPYQLQNLAGTRSGEEATLSARLDALQNCQAEGCRTAED